MKKVIISRLLTLTGFLFFIISVPFNIINLMQEHKVDSNSWLHKYGLWLFAIGFILLIAGRIATPKDKKAIRPMKIDQNKNF